MLFKVGQVKSYMIWKYLQYGKIIEVYEEDKTYLIENLKTKEKHVVDEGDIFLGDD